MIALRARRLGARFLPAALVLGLFVLVGASRTPPGPMMPMIPPAPCTQYSQSSGGASIANMALGDGVVQPLLEGKPIYACSLHVSRTGYYSSATMYVREWDLLAMAPDPSTIALRTQYMTPSQMTWASGPWVIMSLITESAAGVADPPRRTVAVEFRSQKDSYNPYGLDAWYEPQGNPALPAAQSVSAGGTHAPLTGDHPVLGHAVCDGGAALADLRVVQAVNRTDQVLASHPFEIVQRFRMTEPAELRWIELAVNGANPTPIATATAGEEMPVQPNATIAIVDASSWTEPPADLPPPFVEGVLEQAYNFTSGAYRPGPRWGSHLEFDHTVTLQPNHDYWIHVRYANDYEFLAHRSSGSETPLFLATIGDLHTRSAVGAPWTLAASQALSFKLIGLPLAPIHTVDAPPRHEAFALAVAPNPARGLTQVNWSGAVAPVKLEVLDARGRRVARGEGGAAGTWAWAPAGADGRPLAAGVYFVHARDSAGELAVERVVLVR